MDDGLKAAIERLHTPVTEEAEIWADGAGKEMHADLFPACDPNDCEGHEIEMQVCSECGYMHDGESVLYRAWPCPTISALRAWLVEREPRGCLRATLPPQWDTPANREHIRRVTLAAWPGEPFHFTDEPCTHESLMEREPTDTAPSEAEIKAAIRALKLEDGVPVSAMFPWQDARYERRAHAALVAARKATSDE